MSYKKTWRKKYKYDEFKKCYCKQTCIWKLPCMHSKDPSYNNTVDKWCPVTLHRCTGVMSKSEITGNFECEEKDVVNALIRDAVGFNRILILLNKAFPKWSPTLKPSYNEFLA